MQRQSLGSPLSKLKHDVTLAASTPSSSQHDVVEQLKPPKPRRFSISDSSSFSHNLIHFVPLLTLVCFLILYLNSHNPSPTDMAQFNGFKRISVSNGGAEVDGEEALTAVNRADIVATRSMRHLRQINVADNPKSRLAPRKLADF